MPCNKAIKRRSRCPLNATLEALGDHWSLLIVRDLMFLERRTFKDFLEAGEGISTNILTNRLQRLEDEEIIARKPDLEDGRKSIYSLTDRGIDLAPTLIEMIVWGARYADTDAPAPVIKEMREKREQVIADIRRKWKAQNRR